MPIASGIFVCWRVGVLNYYEMCQFTGMMELADTVSICEFVAFFKIRKFVYSADLHNSGLL